MRLNGLKLNIEKTQLIVLDNSSNVTKIGQVSLEHDGSIIRSSETIKSLGFVIDSRLTWAQQINRISRSHHLAARSIYPLRSVLSEKYFLLVYACIMSIFDYMVIIWGTASKQCLSNVDRCIRRTARYVLHKTKYEIVSSDICNRLKWFSPLKTTNTGPFVFCII
jgi:hypothetical protein